MIHDSRGLLVDRLHEDLLGPSSPDEVLTDRPTDRYLTGILFPRRLEFEAAEDEKLNNGSAAGSGESADDPEDVPPTNLHKPSAAGISFCIAFPEGLSPAILVQISGGTYTRRTVREKGKRREEGRAGAHSVGESYDAAVASDSVSADTGKEGESAGDSETEIRTRVEWLRVAHDLEVTVSLSGQNEVDVPLEEHGLKNFSLYVTTAPISAGMMVTVRLVNDQEWKPGAEDGNRPDEMCLLQVGLGVRAIAPATLVARPDADVIGDEDSLPAKLLYRNVREFAVGHTCSAAWRGASGDTVESVHSSWLPEQTVKMVSADGAPLLRMAVKFASDSVGEDPLSASSLASAGDQLSRMLEAVPSGYEAWIGERRRDSERLTGMLREQAIVHLEACGTALERMRRGIGKIESDLDIRAAFLLMNRSMSVQRAWTETVRARREGKDNGGLSNGLRWYPFQLAFILQSIDSIADDSSPERHVMDLLWFPTGGGKTEAYLGLISFTAFLRRIRRIDTADRGGGVSCIMRYTLRLLTLQQFQRAATLMMACEMVRLGHDAPVGTPDLTGAAPFSVGLWVGGDATPNTLAQAISALTDPYAASSPRQLTTCPCCGSALAWKTKSDSTDIDVICQNESCLLALAVPRLPVRTVDELIYQDPPTLLFATVDKFAQIVRSEKTRALFNTGRAPAPELIIQDELHLISGPLGTLTALYECAIDRICTRDGRPPKIIGSTATIRRADEQIRALFNRTAAQFPPPGLDIDDSCFAFVEVDAPTRRYVGVTTAGRSAKFTLQAVYGSLLQSAESIDEPARRDGYHTLVGYFNALRELGGALVLCQDDVPAGMELITARRGEIVRDAKEVVELTSRVSQQDIRRILDQLELRCDNEGAVDVLLATNMISVGVDVSRLALMVVMGQPKGLSEYIQATSRVGRDRLAPGLVVTVLNANKARDRAHFESFTGIHQALYRGVEATSVTPFAARARDRALHAAVVAAFRHLVTGMAGLPAIPAGDRRMVESLVADIAKRAAVVDPEEAAATADDLARILELWDFRASAVSQYWNDNVGLNSLLLSAEKAAARNRSGISAAEPWPTLNSMRTVEAGTPFRLVERLREAR